MSYKDHLLNIEDHLPFERKIFYRFEQKLIAKSNTSTYHLQFSQKYLSCYSSLTKGNDKHSC